MNYSLSRFLTKCYYRFLGLMRAGYILLSTGKLKDTYCIKAWYLPRRRYIAFDDRTNTDQCQDMVYQAMQSFFMENNLSSLVDIGCGSGYKHVKFFGDYDTVGMEVLPTLDFLKETYPDRRWQLSDFNNPPRETFDMAICIDVIEHLLGPDELMDYIRQIDCKYVGISSPDRDHLGGRGKIGPPMNEHHIREWSRDELVAYVSKYFTVIKSDVVNDYEHYVICVKS
jgi:hypothetical protein